MLTHSGFWPLKSRPCDPIYFDDILLDFPNLTVIFAHLGRGWQNVLFEMGVQSSNAATDFSGWQNQALRQFKEFCTNLRMAIDKFGPGRVVFGTDGPFYRRVMSNKDYVQLIKDLPQKSADGIIFTLEEVEALLGKNAARILSISDL